MYQFELFPLAAGFVDALKQWDSDWKIHPILVNFTAALVPVSVASDIAARLFRREALREVGWWTMFYAGVITPFTALFGWLFWMPDDNGAHNMAIHKWLGSGLAVAFIALLIWRWWFHKHRRWPNLAYFLVGTVTIGCLMYQGHLGGQQTFGPMNMSWIMPPTDPVPIVNGGQPADPIPVWSAVPLAFQPRPAPVTPPQMGGGRSSPTHLKSLQDGLSTSCGLRSQRVAARAQLIWTEYMENLCIEAP
jgi:uncharacterized membrane protein